MASFTFTGPGGSDPVSDIKQLAVRVQPTAADALYALDRQKTRILQRTQAGTAFDGTSFVPYSPAYAKRKGNSSPVDLTWSGLMNKAMLATVNGSASAFGDAPIGDSVFALGFYGEEALRASAHNEGATIKTRLGSGKKTKKNGAASFRMPQRRFFDASSSDLDQMQRDIGEHARARLGS